MNPKSEVWENEFTEYLFELIESESDADRIIEMLINHMAQKLGTDDIALREIVEDERVGRVLRCTYEWSTDNASSMLGADIECTDALIASMEQQYASNPDGVYLFTSGEGGLSCPVTRKVASCLEIPIYHSEYFVGCVDFSYFDEKHEWSIEEITQLKYVFRMMVAYLFTLREDEFNPYREIFSIMDKVTGLPRYDEFLRCISRAQAQDDGMELAIVCSDISNFKYINEKYGYATGDRMLKLFATCFYECFSDAVTCCHEYSDNFCMAIKCSPEDEPEEIKHKVDEFAKYYVHSAREKILDSNFIINSGICFMNKGDDRDAAISNANAARKHAREIKTPACCKTSVFRKSMQMKTEREMELVAGCDDAIETNEFKVYLQPKVLCKNKKIIGAEALIRWQRHNGSFIYPDEFIPAFEKSGKIVNTDYFVYETTYRYLRDRLDKGLKVVPVSMNVSRVHLFSRSFISFIKLLNSRYKVPVEYLEFELTENIYIDDLPMAVYTIDSLRSMGIKVSIDDFGSGYSSFGMLANVTTDIIKLDRIFLKEEMTAKDETVIASVIEMAQKLGIEVICEGVETEEQREFLLNSGCNMMQGYLFSKPVTIEQFNALLDREE